MIDTVSTSALRLQFRAPGTKVTSSIRYALGCSAESHVLVARTDRGVCAIFLGEAPDALRHELAKAFPGAVRQEDPLALHDDLARVVDFIATGATDAFIDLDIGGTAFQQQVWQALCEIPAGETRSYTELAHSIGASHAVRAVAGACAANVLAVVIPCHRIVRRDGSISGYRWGAERKRALLNKERKKESV